MILDLSSLRKAVVSLEKALKVSALNISSPDVKETLRAGVIQNFEFTYELCWKFIQRWLKENEPSDEINLPRTRKDLFRKAADKGLIKDPVPWFEFADARNLTSHAYDEEKAEIVYQSAKRFILDAQYLLKQLEQKNA